MPKKGKAQLGSISSGTLNAAELADAFASELKRLGGDKQLVADAEAALEDEDEDALDELVPELESALEEFAPPYAYFGTHQGDGADFGFWVSHESIDDAVRSGDALRVNDSGDVPKGYSGDVFVVSDHGNVTLYRAARGRLTEVWGIV